MPGLHVMCRLCTKKYSSAALMENIFIGEAVTAETIKAVTQIDVAKGDGLPQHVCMFCILALNSAKNFIQSCIDSNAKLQLQFKMRGLKLLKTEMIKKSLSPVLTPSSFFRNPKIEPITPILSDCVARRLEVEIDAQEKADNEPEEEDIIDGSSATDISKAEIDTGNNVEAQVAKTAQVEITEAAGGVVPNPDDHQNPKAGSPKVADCKQQPSETATNLMSPGLYLKNEPNLDESAVVLSWYDSDLNLVIDKGDFLSAVPVHVKAFGYMWAGARATYGFASGKLAFQIKVEEDLDVSHLGNEPCPNALRVGWSVPSASMQLGEEPRSYGFCSTGRAFTDCKDKNRGLPFKVGDVVTSYLEWAEKDALLSFAVNGKARGIAFRVPRVELNGQPLFPHVLSKNRRFSVNFGAREKPWYSLDRGFVFVDAVPKESRMPGPRRPETKEECEMVMMCGLPGAGKTTWVNQYVAQVPEKKFNILGIDALIDKMRVNGLPRKDYFKGPWEDLTDQCKRCIVKLLEVATGRRRNYILDQTNVDQASQKRKMCGFERFMCRAVVIVPDDKEFKMRVAKQEAQDGKGLLDSAMLEMKASFALPEEGDVFSSVTFAELDRKRAQVLVKQYRKEGQKAGYSDQRKRPRSSSFSSLDGSFCFQGRDYRTKCGRDNAGQRSRGGGWNSRDHSRGNGHVRNDYREKQGGSSQNRHNRSHDRHALQQRTAQNTAGHHHQRHGGPWSSDSVWMQNLYQPQDFGHVWQGTGHNQQSTYAQPSNYWNSTYWKTRHHQVYYR